MPLVHWCDTVTPAIRPEFASQSSFVDRSKERPKRFNVHEANCYPADEVVVDDKSRLRASPSLNVLLGRFLRPYRSESSRFCNKDDKSLSLSHTTCRCWQKLTA